MYIPAGMAHGYAVIEGPAIFAYTAGDLFDADLDSGILWNSCGIDWGIDDPILSENDRKLVPLNDFCSPFEYVE